MTDQQAEDYPQVFEVVRCVDEGGFYRQVVWWRAFSASPEFWHSICARPSLIAETCAGAVMVTVGPSVRQAQGGADACGT